MRKKNKIIAKNNGENDDQEEDNDHTAKIQTFFFFFKPPFLPHTEIHLSSSLVEMESQASLFLSCSYVMLKTLQEKHRKAGRTTGS